MPDYLYTWPRSDGQPLPFLLHAWFLHSWETGLPCPGGGGPGARPGGCSVPLLLCTGIWGAAFSWEVKRGCLQGQGFWNGTHAGFLLSLWLALSVINGEIACSCECSLARNGTQSLQLGHFSHEVRDCAIFPACSWQWCGGPPLKVTEEGLRAEGSCIPNLLCILGCTEMASDPVLQSILRCAG